MKAYLLAGLFIVVVLAGCSGVQTDIPVQEEPFDDFPLETESQAQAYVEYLATQENTYPSKCTSDIQVNQVEEGWRVFCWDRSNTCDSSIEYVMNSSGDIQGTPTVMSNC